MKPELTLIPMISIHPDKICTYKEVNWQPQKPSKYDQETGEQIKSIKVEHLLDSDRKSHGIVSDIARRKIGKALDYLLLLAQDKKVNLEKSGRHFMFKLAFVTLTLPSTQVHDDKTIKREILNQFLVELKKHYYVSNYLWRAEKQKNGNLHFHLIIDKFIPWSELRDRWNRVCNKLGYVDRYRDEMKAYHSGGFRVRKDLIEKWSYKSQVKAYKAGVANDWNSPNSTDIHSIRKVWNVKKYVAKYMTKQAEQQNEVNNESESFMAQTGRIWGCAQLLSNPKGAKVVMDSYAEEQLVKAIERTECRSYHGEYFDVWYIDFEDLARSGASDLYKAFCSYLLERFNYSHQSSFT